MRVPALSRRRSWLQALVAALDGLPGPAWAAYLGAGLIVGGITQQQAWENGQAASGTLWVPSLYWGAMATSLLWCTTYFQRVALDAFTTFEPALGHADVDAERLRRDLVVIPPLPAAIILGGAILLTVAAFTLAPGDAGVAGVSAPTMVASFVIQTLAAGALFTLGYQLIHLTRVVRRAMADAEVDVFRPSALQALPRLTARMGAILAVVVEASLLVVPPPSDPASFLVNSAPFIIVPPILAALAFLVPLQDVHGRLEAEKDRQLGAAELRIVRVMAEINGDVDAGRLDRADALGKQLASMVQQRDLIARLSTWPWSAGTLRGLITAILLPTFLFVVQQLLARVL